MWVFEDEKKAKAFDGNCSPRRQSWFSVKEEGKVEVFKASLFIFFSLKNPHVLKKPFRVHFFG